MDSWEIVWRERGLLLAGLQSTLELFLLAGIMAFAIGVLVLIALEGKLNPLRRALKLLIDVMRMLPCLIYAYLLYYGLPAFGLRLDAWMAGLIALTTYHAAYCAEILRGARAELSPGQAEAARAHGYRTLPMIVRIVLPQLLYKTGPVLGNQAIICLKDTAFLTIITVTELTSAATTIQAQYFVPVQSFVAAIGLYWVVCLCIEWVVRKLGRAATHRGIGNA